jgi:hypothetical protein
MRTGVKAVTLGTAAAVAAMLVSGCSSLEIHGTVTSKEFLPSYTTYYSQSVYTQTCVTEEEEEPEEEPEDKGTEEEEEPVQVCTSHYAGSRRVPILHSSCWQLSVAGKDGGDECVSESTYDNTKIGSTV